MASTGDIFSLHDGETVTIVTSAQDSGGTLLEVEAGWGPSPGRPPVHLHPLQDERFEIHEGELSVRLRGTTHVLRAGDALDVPRGVPHSMWHSGAGPTRASWQVRPALRTEHFFEAVHNMRAAGHTGRGGMITLPAAGLVFRAFPDEFRLAIPAPVLGPAIALLAMIGRLRGYASVAPARSPAIRGTTVP